MSIRKMTLERWQKLTAAALQDGDAAALAALQGTSPGGVAADLRISRQAVHEAMHRGDLDAIVITGNRPRQRPLMILITAASIAAFKRLRSERKRA